MTVGRVVGSVHPAPLTRDQRVDTGPGTVHVPRTGRGRSGAGPVACVRPPQSGPRPGREEPWARDHRISACRCATRQTNSKLDPTGALGPAPAPPPGPGARALPSAALLRALVIELPHRKVVDLVCHPSDSKTLFSATHHHCSDKNTAAGSMPPAYSAPYETLTLLTVSLVAL